MDLNPAQVRTLAAVAREGSFSRAAQRLHLSQPAVSLHIRALEERLGLPLLRRTGRRAVPTRAGAVLLAHADRAFAELEAGEHALHALRGRVAGPVRVGTGATASIHLLPPVLGTLRRQHPALELSLVTGDTADIVAGVAAGDLDLAVVTLPAPGTRRLEVTPFFTDVLVGIGPPDGSRARRRALSPEALTRHPLILYARGGAIRPLIDRWLRAGRARPRVIMELGDVEAIKRLVAAGLGWSVASAVAVEMERRAGGLSVHALRPRLARRLGLVRRRDATPSPAVEAVRGALEAWSRRRARIS
jgi:DNA-binding transcriptional LysR family regulator